MTGNGANHTFSRAMVDEEGIALSLASDSSVTSSESPRCLLAGLPTGDGDAVGELIGGKK